MKKTGEPSGSPAMVHFLNGQNVLIGAQRNGIFLEGTVVSQLLIVEAVIETEGEYDGRMALSQGIGNCNKQAEGVLHQRIDLVLSLDLAIPGRTVIVLIPSSREPVALIRAAVRFSNPAAQNKNPEAKKLRGFYGAASQI